MTDRNTRRRRRSVLGRGLLGLAVGPRAASDCPRQPRTLSGRYCHFPKPRAPGPLSPMRGVMRHQPAPRARAPILVRRRQRDREIGEGASLAREEPPVHLLFLQENGGRATAMLHPARDQTHLARATTASPAAEDNLRSRPQDSAQHGLLATTHDGIPDRAQRDRVQPILARAAASTHLMSGHDLCGERSRPMSVTTYV